MMKREEFDRVTRALLKRDPFQPFLIECEDGRRFVVGEPSALHSFAGSATFFHPDGSMDLLDNENVARVVELTVPATK
jgi:hypothetical protein